MFIFSNKNKKTTKVFPFRNYKLNQLTNLSKCQQCGPRYLPHQVIFILITVNHMTEILLMINVIPRYLPHQVIFILITVNHMTEILLMINVIALDVVPPLV